MPDDDEMTGADYDAITTPSLRWDSLELKSFTCRTTTSLEEWFVHYPELMSQITRLDIAGYLPRLLFTRCPKLKVLDVAPSHNRVLPSTEAIWDPLQEQLKHVDQTSLKTISMDDWRSDPRGVFIDNAHPLYETAERLGIDFQSWLRRFLDSNKS